VGAAIAAGSHAEKGICALLEIAPKKTKQKKTKIPTTPPLSHEKIPPPQKKKKEHKKNTSPKRLLKTVIRPESNLT